MKFGKSKKYTLDAYRGILASQEEFIELSMFSDELPKFAIRRSEILALALDPQDESLAGHYSSAVSRAIASDLDGVIKRHDAVRLAEEARKHGTTG